MVPKSVTVSSVGWGPRSVFLGRVEGGGAEMWEVVERVRRGNGTDGAGRAWQAGRIEQV